MGKSSVIQALLVLRQSFETGDLQEGRLVLGGALTDLGAGSDVLFEDAGDEIVGFTLHSDQAHPPWTRRFGYSRGSDQLVAIRELSTGGNLQNVAHGAPCPVTGQPTKGRSVFAGLGSDAKAKSAVNALLRNDPGADARLAGFADPRRIKAAAAKAKAAGLSHIDRVNDWLRADSEADSSGVGVVPSWQVSSPFGGRLIYVQADRTGPRKSYPLSEVLARRGDFGRRGEYAWNYLNDHQNDSLPAADPRCGDGSTRRLRGAVDHWLQDVSPGAHLQLESVLAADAVLAGFTFDRPGGRHVTEAPRDQRGLRAVLRVPGCAGLAVRARYTLPHREPGSAPSSRGQTRLAELTARAAAAGVQVFVETHSDHFLDGVRLAIHDGLIPPADTAISLLRARSWPSGRVVANCRRRRTPVPLAGWFLRSARRESREVARAPELIVREMILNHASFAPTGWRDALRFLPDLADGMAVLVRAGAAQSTLRMSRSFARNVLA